MNKGELVDAIAAKVNVTKKQADEVIRQGKTMHLYFQERKS